MRFFTTLFALFSLSSPALAAPATCGDGVIGGRELCDGSELAGQTCASLGLGGGLLSCTDNCRFDLQSCDTLPECGNDMIEGPEECDGAADQACPGACSAHCQCPSAPATGRLRMRMIDVGQGDGMVMISPDGFVMLVDAGTHANGAQIAAGLRRAGIRRVDYTLVSHLDADHIGGMDTVIDENPEIGVCFDHGGTHNTAQFQEYDEAAGERRQTLVVGDTIDLGPSMEVEVLHAYTGTSSENDNSIVLRLQHGNTSMLLGGDCEGPCEAALDPGHVDIYKVHHHGSASSTSPDFLDRITPYTGLMSLGAGNIYGHPDPGVVDDLETAGVDVYRTDLDGHLDLVSDGWAYRVNGDPVCYPGETRYCGTTATGTCGLGVQSCDGGIWGTCQGATEPVQEICGNGLDDDCDGLVDADDAFCGAGRGVVISQVAYDTPGSDHLEEFVELYNPGTGPIAIGGWTLHDHSGSWTIPPNMSIPAQGRFTIARDSRGFRSLYGLYPHTGGLSLSLGNSGDVLSLIHSNGSVVDEVAWEGFVDDWTLGAPSGASLLRPTPDLDSDTPRDWRVSVTASPAGW